MGARPEVPPTGNENEPLSGRRISARITRGARGRLSKCVASKVDSMKGCAVRRAFLPSHSTCLKRFIASRCQCNAGYCHKGAFASCIKGTKGPSSAPHSKSKAGHHGLPAFSHWQEALHSATPTFSYGLGHWKISHTGHFAHFYSACKLSVTCFGSEVDSRYMFVSVIRNWHPEPMDVSVFLLNSRFKQIQLKEERTAWVFPDNLRFESHSRSNQTSSECCKRRRKKKSPTAKSSCQNK